MNASSRDVAWDLADAVATTPYSALSRADVDATKRLILDTLACLLAGSAEPPFAELLRLYTQQGGTPEATVMVHGTLLPATNALVVNSGMARALDLDDVHEDAIVHTGVHVVPAALAVAERKVALGRAPVRGDEMIAAVALAQDLMIRLSLACETRPILQGRPGTYLFGTFATAALTARLTGLDGPATVDALGNAYARAAGTTLGYREGALAQRAMQGLSASAGVFAALMAAAGIGGIRSCLEGDGGYYTVHERGRYDRRVLLDGLGGRFLGTATALKPYPVHRGAVLDLEVALVAQRAHSIDPAQIARVEVHYPARFASGYERIGAFAPERAHPRGDVEPHFSSSWAVAVALARGTASIHDFTAAGVAQLAPEVVPVARLVVGVPDVRLDAECTGLGAREIVVTHRDGTTITERIEHAPGSPEHPLSWDAVVAKFDDGASRAARPIASDRLDTVVRMIAALETVEDVGLIPAALA